MFQLVLATLKSSLNTIFLQLAVWYEYNAIWKVTLHIGNTFFFLTLSFCLIIKKIIPSEYFKGGEMFFVF